MRAKNRKRKSISLNNRTAGAIRRMACAAAAAAGMTVSFQNCDAAAAGAQTRPAAQAILNEKLLMPGHTAGMHIQQKTSGEFAIIQKPVPFPPEREQLMLEYLLLHYGADASLEINPDVIVIHTTELPTLDASWKTFKPNKLPAGRRDIIKAGAVNVSAHFLVDRDGSVYQLMPSTMAARHTIGLNLDAIGIENVGGTTKWPLTDAQLQADAQLVRELSGKFRIKYLFGHYETEKLRKTALWKEKVSGYITHKSDPGTKFMEKLRGLVSDLGLKGLPEAPK